MADQREFKGVWIPREIWLDTNLSALEKVLFAEIDSLSGYEKMCIKSNATFAEFCQCSESKVSKAVKKLIDLGYVKQVAFDGRHRTLQSCLAQNASLNSTKSYSAQHKVTASNPESNPESKTKENTPYNPPEGEGTQDFKSLLDAFKADMCNTDNQQKEEKLGFDDWYSHYPRKQARQRAEKAWKKIKPDQKLIKHMIDSVEVMKTKESWTKDNGQYIPLPATWLNDGRWDDEEAQPPEKHRYELLFDDNDTIEERFFGDKVKVKVIKDD